MKKIKITIFLMLLSCGVHAADWPTYRHDNQRSGISSDKLPSKLNLLWERKSKIPPTPAWSGPAKWDAYVANEKLQAMRNFDPVYFTTATGNRIYYGSSVDNAVHCLNAETGKEEWVFFTGGPVRLPPSYSKGKCYFGSDDGFAYCVDAKNGKLIWRFSPVEKSLLVPSNGKFISKSPCRTGVLIEKDIAYFAFSLLPWKKSWLCAVDALKGQANGTGKYIHPHKSGRTFQGAMLTSGNQLLVPQGRLAPMIFDLKNGKTIGQVKKGGGTYCVITQEGIVSGPGNQKNKDDVLQLATEKGDFLLTLPRTDKAIIDGSMAYLHQGSTLNALDLPAYKKIQLTLNKKKAQLRNKKTPKEVKTKLQKEIKALTPKLNSSYKWEINHPKPFDMIKTANKIVLGLKNEVLTIDATSGKKLWTAPVDGNAYGLTVADKRLYVSTDKGDIYCFGEINY